MIRSFVGSDALPGILFHVEEALNKPDLETVTGQHEKVGSRLSAALDPIIKRIVKKVLNSTEYNGQIAETVINNSELVSSAAAFVKSEQQKYNEERVKTVERCPQFVKAGIKPDPVAVSHPLKIGKKPHINFYDNVKNNLKACLLSFSQSGSNSYNSRPMKPTRTSKFRRQKETKRDVPGLTFISQ